ncbi:MAG: AAA family ATPase [Magnetospirillum sp. WYHS-4]
MIKSLRIKNLTAFPSVELDISRQLNVIVGENGTGKTHLLKLMYSVLAMSAEEGRKPTAAPPTKTFYQTRLAEKLVNVFRPESLGRLARRRPGRERCDVSVKFRDKKLDIDFSFATNSKTEVAISRLPETWVSHSSAYIPTRELLSIYPSFVSVYESHYLEFEETWRDTCVLLGALLRRGPKEAIIGKLHEPLEAAMGGAIELDRNGRFYLKTASGRMEMPLVAEGLRKLGMIARLIATGALLDNGCLFWDEPEANLNPRLTKTVAKTILDLSANGIQVFLATHSLFLLRELEILLAKTGAEISPCFIGLHETRDGVGVEHGPSVDDIGDIAALDEELLQSDRFLEVAK